MRSSRVLGEPAPLDDKGGTDNARGIELSCRVDPDVGEPKFFRSVANRIQISEINLRFMDHNAIARLRVDKRFGHQRMKVAVVLSNAIPQRETRSPRAVSRVGAPQKPTEILRARLPTGSASGTVGDVVSANLS